MRGWLTMLCLACAVLGLVPGLRCAPAAAALTEIVGQHSYTMDGFPTVRLAPAYTLDSYAVDQDESLIRYMAEFVMPSNDWHGPVSVELAFVLLADATKQIEPAGSEVVRVHGLDFEVRVAPPEAPSRAPGDSPHAESAGRAGRADPGAERVSPTAVLAVSRILDSQHLLLFYVSMDMALLRLASLRQDSTQAAMLEILNRAIVSIEPPASAE